LYLGVISFGTLTSVVQLVNQIQAPFAGISGIMPQYYSVLASAERIIEIEALPEEPLEYPLLDRRRAYDGLERMTFENICFSYGREVVLKDASLEIKKGDFVVIGGISGIGKSTLIKLLLGVIKPQKGRILLRINGEDVPAGKHSRPLFSYVPQGNLLLSGTIREAVSVANENLSDEKIMAAARISCADTFIERLPDGLDTYIGEKGFGLSEGQIQRLAITRAILSDAPIILLDEATSALDETTEARLLNNIKELKDKTCVIISHKRAAFEICNKHVFIEEQRIRTEE
jgi:ATP-binding cassette subfamily B protein